MLNTLLHLTEITIIEREYKMIERVLEMWNEGKTEREIAKKFDVSKTTIEKILIQQGVYYGGELY